MQLRIPERGLVSFVFTAVQRFPLQLSFSIVYDIFQTSSSDNKKRFRISSEAFFVQVGDYLFSRAVSSELSSAQVSLTSVFGMGTGGTSPSSTPTDLTGSV